MNSSSKTGFLQKPAIKRFVLTTNSPKLRSRNNSPSSSDIAETKEERKTSLVIERNDLVEIKKSILKITQPKNLVRKRSLSPLQRPIERKSIEKVFALIFIFYFLIIKMPLEMFDLLEENENLDLKNKKNAFSPYYDKGFLI